MSTSLLIDSLDAVALAMPRIMELATQEERADVVAWLRDGAYLQLYEETPQALADMIERGEHRREAAP